jgi:DNA (cytosine-5)-methyltransferase 1
MKVLDLFCGMGGAGMGYHQAGYEVFGVDKAFQPFYPFKMEQKDVFAFLENANPDDYDLIHASPPCQAYSFATVKHRNLGKEYPDLVGPTRDALKKFGKPYIMENVLNAPLDNPITLCGEMFGLRVIRHRLFESNMPIQAPPHKPHRGRVRDGYYVTVVGHGGGVKWGSSSLREWQDAMGIWWGDRKGLTQAIPPAYTRYLGIEARKYL